LIHVHVHLNNKTKIMQEGQPNKRAGDLVDAKKMSYEEQNEKLGKPKT